MTNGEHSARPGTSPADAVRAGAGTRGGPAAPETAGDMLRMAREFLQRKSIEEWRLEAELLVAHALGLDRLHLFLQLDRPVTAAEVDRARDLLVRRGRREPAAYILGAREFFGRSFQVGRGVLVPRPETEVIVDLAHDFVRARAKGGHGAAAPLAIADLGTGSGALALTLALEFAHARVWAVDLSPAACLCARSNLERLVPADERARVTLVEGDGIPELERVVRERGAPFDLLVSNPPYVLREDAASLAPEVRDYEPELALFAPAGDPDHWVKRILAAWPELVAPDGLALVELGVPQAPRALALAAKAGLAARVVPDLAGLPRVLELRRPGPSA